MAFTMNIWKVDGDKLTELSKHQLDSEKRLEDWIEQDCSVLGMQLLIIGRQVPTDGGPIDLLALDQDASTVVIELKRDKTPREVVAQVLDYASCVRNLSGSDLSEIWDNYVRKYGRKPAGTTLAEGFRAHFGFSLPETVNASHSMVVVASRLDDSSERIVNYLQKEHRININAVFFNVFKTENGEILARSWLTDPESAAENAQDSSNAKAVWSGFWYVNVGEDQFRAWNDCKKYGFLSAGYGSKYSDRLNNLNPGDKVFAYLKGHGYVGFGTVKERAVMVRDFFVDSEGNHLLNLPLQQPNLAHDKDDPELSEYAVKIEWYKTFDKEDAQWFPGAFANQNIVCQLREGATADFLREKFETVKFP